MKTAKSDLETSDRANESTLKGTFFSVGVVGAVILVTYLLIYGLYMVRA